MASQCSESSLREHDGCHSGMDHEIRKERSPVEDHVSSLVVLVLVEVPTMSPRSPAAWLSLPESRPKAKQARDEEKSVRSMLEGKPIRVYMLHQVAGPLLLIDWKWRRNSYQRFCEIQRENIICY